MRGSDKIKYLTTCGLYLRESFAKDFNQLFLGVSFFLKYLCSKCEASHQGGAPGCKGFPMSALWEIFRQSRDSEASCDDSYGRKAACLQGMWKAIYSTNSTKYSHEDSLQVQVTPNSQSFHVDSSNRANFSSLSTKYNLFLFQKHFSPFFSLSSPSPKILVAFFCHLMELRIKQKDVFYSHLYNMLCSQQFFLLVSSSSYFFFYLLLMSYFIYTQEFHQGIWQHYDLKSFFFFYNKHQYYFLTSNGQKNILSSFSC